MLKQTLALVGLTFSLMSNAAILSIDSNFGTDSVTRDTNSGLDWLDVTITRGLSYDDVTAQMGVGDAYQGWRYATMAELDELIINFGYTAVVKTCSYTSLHCDSGLGSVGGQEEVVETMVRTMGDTYDAYLDSINHYTDVAPDGTGFTIGILGTENIENNRKDVGRFDDHHLVFRNDTTRIHSDYADNVSSSIDSRMYNESQIYTGSFLVAVAPTAVPVPATIWLFGSALLGLAGIKRRK